MTPRTGQRAKGGKPRSYEARRRAQTRGWVVWALMAAAGVLVIAMVLLLLREDGGSGGAPVTGGDLHSLATTDGTTLYVGGHNAVSLSHDGGSTWTPIPSLDDADAMGWAFLDTAVFVGGHPGLSVSTDGGTAFTRHNDGLPATDVHALGGTGVFLYAASPAAGFLASEDGGTTWSVRNQQIGQSFMGRILVDPDDPAHAIAPDMQAGAVETRDGGRTWRALGGVAGAMWVSWDPTDVGHIVVSGAAGAVASSDGGATWTAITVPDGVTVVEMDPTDSDHLFAASHDGSAARIWVSRDSGGTWTAP
jgi:hypothetical protein